MKKIKVGVIGCGYWGPNLIRNFNESISTDIKCVCDLSPQRIKLMNMKYPRMDITTDYKELLDDKDIHAVAIATPVSTHYKLAKESLEKGKHVLVEKPLASTVKQAEELVRLASKRNLVLLVGHTFIYTDAVRKIKNFVSSGKLGEMYYFDSVRVNLGLFQQDISVVWDLAPHDFSIMEFIIDERPTSVVAVGSSHTGCNREDVAYISVQFKSNLTAHFHVNWLSPVKIRRIIIGGSKKMIVFDDLDPAEKIKIYDRGIDVPRQNAKSVYKNLVQYRVGDMSAPAIDNVEALKTEVEHFVDCITNNKRPVTDGETGLQVVRLLEAVDKSLKAGGIKVKL